MNTNAKLNERLVFSRPDEWVPMDIYRQVVATATIAATSPPGQVSVQLRKATDASGSNPADLGAVVTADSQATAQAYASDLGVHAGSGLPFTHVSAVVTPPGSPPVDVAALVIRGDGRFNG